MHVCLIRQWGGVRLGYTKFRRWEVGGLAGGFLALGNLMVQRVIFQILLRTHGYKYASCLVHGPPCVDSVLVSDYHMSS